jgi:hypothetical protein
MPDRDGTGPTGKGPITGRGSGQCILPLNTTKEELNYLKNQENALREQLDMVVTRIRGLEATTCGGKR